MDVKLLGVLEDCNCLQFYKYFTGITLGELRVLPDNLLQSKLSQLLVSVSDKHDDVERIITKIRESRDEDFEEDVKPKIEVLDSEISREGDDDEVEIVNEVFGEVSFVGISTKTVPQLTIDDAHDIKIEDPVSEDETLESSATINTTNDQSASNNQSNDNSSAGGNYDGNSNIVKVIFLPDSIIVSQIEQNAEIHISFSGLGILNQVSSTKSRKRTRSTRSSSLPIAASDWDKLYAACGDKKIKYLDCSYWKWESLDNDTPDNLFRLLSSYCGNLRELCLLTNSCSSTKFSGSLNLPTLKCLRLFYNVSQNDSSETKIFNYELTVRDIITATNGGLEKVEFNYVDMASIKIFLDTLQSLKEDQLKGLKSLFFVSKNKMPGCLQKDECSTLSKLSCLELEHLNLDFNVCGSARIPFQAILSKFPKLRGLVVTGCFKSTNPREAQQILAFPALKKLERLDLGRSQVSVSVFETAESRPPIKKVGESQGEFCPITVKLPGLPKLKQLNFGRLYELEYLHFKRFPELTTFRVCSAWQLAIKLPKENSRQMTYPLIKELQLPDGLQDDTFMRQIMPYFSNVEICWINTPSVKVIRAFSYIMKNSQKLSKLNLTIQFDFPSSLDTFILEKTSDIVQSEEELNNIKTLKEYKHWQKYADFHKIDIPVIQDLPNSLDDEDKYAGLCVLNKYFQNKYSLYIRYVPRTLRLPQGSAHWDDENCKFSDTLIGFQKYPYTLTAFKAAPIGPLWPMGQKCNLVLGRFDTGAIPTIPIQLNEPALFPLDSSAHTQHQPKFEDN